jgi:hypothetical protein
MLVAQRRSPPAMNVVATNCFRNSALQLAHCLEHLAEQDGRTCIVDNGRRVPLTQHLAAEEQLACELDADWFMHYVEAKIKQAPRYWGTLVTPSQKSTGATMPSTSTSSYCIAR